ncbi:MFS transporter [Planctomycetota bacterium]|nr:MFS transporter [Planctomycetota bacterium]
MNQRISSSKPMFKTPRGIIILVTLTLSAMVVWLNASILNVALPAIENELNATLNELQWAVNVFTLCGGLIIVSGRLADAWGRRKLLVIGMALFFISSLMGGFSPNITVLIACRALQGIGGALILPPSLALIETNFHPPHRTIAIGIWIGLAWFAMAVGPAVGGILIEYASWRWTLWVVTPFTILIIISALLSIRESKNLNESSKIDVFGAIAIMLAMFGITYAAIESGITGWFSPLTLFMFITGLLLTIIFLIIERRVENPVLSLKLLKDRTFWGANLVNIISNIAFASILFFSSIYLEIVQNYSALEAGLLLLPATLSILITLNFGSIIYNRIGAKAPTSTGMFILSVGLLLIAIRGEHAGYMGLLGPFVLIGLGIGLFASPITAAALAATTHDEAGRAAGFFKASSMIGAAIGVAVAGSIYQQNAYQKLEVRLQHTSHETKYIMRKIIGGDKDDLGVLQQYAPDRFDELKEVTLTIISSSYTITILFLFILCAACTIIAALMIPRKHHFYAAPSQGQPDISSRQPRLNKNRFDPLNRPSRKPKDKE